MKLLKIFSASFLVLCSFIAFSLVYAVETTAPKTATSNLPANPPAKNKMVLIADTNIYNARVVSQVSNKLNISFDIANGVGVQSGIKYGVSLIKETTKGQTFVDEYVYPEVLSLSSNTTIKKDIVYTAPSNITGEYSVVVMMKNESGMTLGINLAGKIKLTSSVKSVVISPDTCYLSIVGEKANTKFNLFKGVNINDKQNLKLTCTVINNSKSTIVATPTYETHFRSVYGEVVSSTGGDVNPISFKANESKLVSVVLPKVSDPQSYVVKTSFKSGEISSNSVESNYTVSGITATIQNFSLDKDYYAKGENVKMSFVWSLLVNKTSKDKISNPLLNINVSILNDKQQECIVPINKQVDNQKAIGIVELSAVITNDCNNPKVSLLIKDESGNTLDERGLSFETKKDKIEKTNIFNLKSLLSNSKILLMILGIIIVIIFVVYFINLKKKSNETINQ